MRKLMVLVGLLTVGPAGAERIDLNRHDCQMLDKPEYSGIVFQGYVDLMVMPTGPTFRVVIDMGHSEVKDVDAAVTELQSVAGGQLQCLFAAIRWCMNGYRVTYHNRAPKGALRVEGVCK